jgi:hypothetical protein
MQLIMAAWGGWVSRMAIAAIQINRASCQKFEQLTPVRPQPNCNRRRLTNGAGRANPCRVSPAEPMKIASFNINDINRRLSNLLSWV